MMVVRQISDKIIMSNIAHDSKNCGTCRENGRLWIEGYHGKESLNFHIDNDIIQNIAAFHSYGFNLSECCAPTLHVTIHDLMEQLELPVGTSHIQLTHDLNSHNIMPDEITPPCPCGESSVNFHLCDINEGFEQFIRTTFICKDVNLTYKIKHYKLRHGLFQIHIKIFIQKHGLTLSSYRLISNPFEIRHCPTAIHFRPDHAGPVVIFEDSILTFTQYPIFILKTYKHFPKVINLSLHQHFLGSYKHNTLSEFITCQRNCMP